MKLQSLNTFKAGDVITIKSIKGPTARLNDVFISRNRKIRIIEKDKKIYVENAIGNCVELSEATSNRIYGYNALDKALYLIEMKKKMIIGCSVLLVLISSYLGYLLFRQKIVSIQFELNASEITLHTSDDFEPNRFIKVLENAKVIYPDFKADKAGEYELEYVAYNDFKKESRILKVNVTDDSAPELVLSESEINEALFTTCRAYIKEAYDDVDGNILPDVTCSNDLTFKDGKALIEYELEDSSNNVTTAYLTVIENTDIEPEIQSQTIYTAPSLPDLSSYTIVPGD